MSSNGDAGQKSRRTSNDSGSPSGRPVMTPQSAVAHSPQGFLAGDAALSQSQTTVAGAASSHAAAPCQTRVKGLTTSSASSRGRRARLLLHLATVPRTYRNIKRREGILK